MTETITSLRAQERQLKQLHDSGVLDASAYASAQAALAHKLQGALPAAPRASTRLWAGSAAFVLLLAGGGYAWRGSPAAIGAPPAGLAAAPASPPGPTETAASAPPTSAPPAIGREQIEAMVAQLAARMEAQPDDADGWGMLGRANMALGRQDEALAAYQRALKLRPDDANLLTDLADASAVKNGRTLEGEPTQLLERALKLDPANLKALTLAGTAAFNRGDFVTAVRYWDQAVQVGPADNPMVEMSRGGAAEARERGKLPPAVAAAAVPAARPAPAPAPATAAAEGADVTGTVRLSPALQARAAPEDTVFIFARPAEGSRMPLAIVRKQVKDLPYAFKLDDTLAMSPAAKISAAGRVIVGARISKSGQAMPQAGDLEGLSAPVAVGSRGVVVEIAKALP